MNNDNQLITFRIEHIKCLRSWFKNKTEIDKWAGPNFSYPHTQETFARDIKYQELASYSLINAQNELVAFGQFYLRLKHCHLGRLVVNPDFRGQGLAKQLVNELSKLGKKTLEVETLSLFVLSDNKPALNLYQRLGFKEQKYPEQLPIDNCLYLVNFNGLTI